MSYRTVLVIGLLAGISLGGYLLASFLTTGIGFPLDDAWIHQSYARNFGLEGEWSFIAGQPSGGSTSPLWSFFLAIGYRLGLNPYFWTFFLGWVTLTLLGLVSFKAFAFFAPGAARWAILAAGLVVLEWHLSWAAGSGMETLLFGLLITLLIFLISLGETRHLVLGGLVGLGLWIRPDALTLLGLLGLAILIAPVSWQRRVLNGLKTAAGFLILFLPYLGFNWLLSGSVWPNTFYAKQAEYAILTGLPYWQRFLDEFFLPMVGIGMVLLPGFLYFVIISWREKKWLSLAGVLWWLVYIGLYAWRLPVTYQHGRYIMPVMAIYFIWGASGTATAVLGMLSKDRAPIGPNPPGRMKEFSKPTSDNSAPMKGIIGRVTARVWLISGLIVLLLFWYLGARAYARDVALIETEMVAVARWVAANTSPDALIAAHDIGALGFFGDRELVDLAGLVSPEVIPFIRDEEKLGAYLDDRQVSYLVTFPTWYLGLTSGMEPVFESNGKISPALGGENMAVYRWP